MRDSTLETLATRMNVETDAMVRRGLEESIYDLLDENTGYLTRGCAPALKMRTRTPSAPDTKLWCMIRRKCWRKFCELQSP